MRRPGALAILVLAGAPLGLAWAQETRGPEAAGLADTLRGHLEFLASDALRGRGSGTHDEWVAATYVAAELRKLGLQPAGDDGGYLQRVELERRRLASPVLTFRAGGPSSPRWLDKPSSPRWLDEQERRFTHGREVVIARLGAPRVSGPLHRMRADAPPAPEDVRGRAVLVQGTGGSRRTVVQLLAMGAIAVLVPVPREDRLWIDRAAAPIDTPVRVKGLPEESSAPGSPPSPDRRGAIVLIDAPVVQWLNGVAEGTPVEMATDEAPPEAAVTWNVLATSKGKGPRAAQVVLLSAHLDHLGTNAGLCGDSIFNGADDDASGVAAVLELARALSREGPGGRTALFALFGSEESGGLGARYFLERPPVPLADIVANLQFEMVGRPDPAVPRGTAWLTGFELSDLGPALARQGAPVVADPHPEENFFQRSDNYRLARRGVVAHTISTFGLHRDYHGVDDEVDRLDFTHLAQVTASMVRPVRWLLDSDFTPRWQDAPP